MIHDSLAGRYVLWRAPTDRDYLRFPSEPAGSPSDAPCLPARAQPLPLEGVLAPASGAWKGGTLRALLESTGTTAFVVLRDGQVAWQWSARGATPAAPGRTLSVTKSVAALLVGQAIGDGRLPGIDAPIGDLVDGLEDPGVARLTLAQLLRMASGIRYREGVLPWSDDVQVYHGTRLREAVRRVRVADPVDAYFHYNDWHPLLIALALERASHASVARLVARDLWGPLGAGPATMTLDHRGPGALAHLESGLNATPLGLACFGQLVLQRGRWGARQLVPAAWLDRLEDPMGMWREPAAFAWYREHRLPWGRPLSSGRFGYKDFWWHHFVREGVHDVFAMGALGAHVYVSRDTGCVLVRQASRFPKGLWWAGVLRAIAEAAAAA